MIRFRNSELSAQPSAVAVDPPQCARFIFAVLVFVCAFLPSSSRASESASLAEYTDLPYHAQTWTTEQGLPGDTVHAVLQTEDGYLWVATQAGLARFDGVRFVNFSQENVKEFRNSECSALLEDRNHVLWIGTIGGGLLRYKDGMFTAYGRKDGLPSDTINSLHEDQAGRLWITSYEALTVFANGQFQSFSIADGGKSVYALAFHEDEAGRVWFFQSRGLNATNPGSLLFYQAGKLHSGDEARPPFPLKFDSALTAFAGRSGSLWIIDRAAHQFLKFSEGNQAAERTVYEPTESPTLAHEDPEGNLWFANGRSELRVARAGNIARLNATLPSRVPITALYRDHEGNLWVGSSAGLTRLKRQVFKSYTTADGLSNDTVWTTFEDSRGDLWFGTNGGVSRYHDGKFTVYNPANGMHGNGAVSITEDAAGYLWFATTSRLTSLKDGKFAEYARPEGLLSENVRSVFVDRAQRLWVGTIGGLHLFEGGRFKAFTTADGLSHNQVLCINEDRAGNLWVGTANGVNRFRDGRFQSLTTRDGLGSNIVIAIHEDADGAVWLGMVGGGLARFKDGKIVSLPTAAGLGDETITNILEDDQGNFWFGSTRGVLRASRKDLNDFADGRSKSFTCIAYGKTDGLPTTDCSGGTQPAGWRGRDGRLWFPTSKGVAVIDPHDLRRNDIRPPVVIEGLVVDRETKSLAASVSLQPGSRAIEFHFTGLSFVDPAKVKFRYKLEGFEREWTEAGTRREAFYTNLPPGTYNFRVIAANNDGVWNEAGATLALTLRPYFYQTVWFYLLVALLLAAASWSIHLFRVKQLRREFAAVLGERNRIARELHDTLAQGFTSVSMQLEAVAAKLSGTPEGAREHLNQARLLVRSSLAEARRSVRDLRSEMLSSDDLGEALKKISVQLTAGASVKASVEVKGKPRRLPELVEKNFLRLGQEALTNAVKYAEAERIELCLGYNADQVTLNVRDNGRGFNPEETNGLGNGGFGLKGMRERVAEIGGRIAIDSCPGDGTTISITVPLV